MVNSTQQSPRKNSNVIRGIILLLFALIIIVYSIGGLSIHKTYAELAGDSSILMPNLITNLKTTSSSTHQEINSTKTTVKEFILDRIAVTTANILLNKLIKSTLNWVNSGFKGNPLYLSNPNQTFTNIQYQKATEVAKQLKGDIETGYNRDVLWVLGQKNSLFVNRKEDITDFTLDKVVGKNWKSFASGDEFSWGGYLAIGQGVNNPYNAIFKAKQKIIDDIEEELGDQKGKLVKELEQGSGFLGQRKCLDSSDDNLDSDGDGVGNINDWCPNTRKNPDSTGPRTTVDRKGCGPGQQARSPNASSGEATSCDNYEIITPGKSVQDATAQSLGVSQRKLEQIKSITDLSSIVFAELATQAINAGLRALTDKDTEEDENADRDAFYNIVSSEDPSAGGSSEDPDYDWANTPRVVDIEQMLYGKRKPPLSLSGLTTEELISLVGSLIGPPVYESEDEDIDPSITIDEDGTMIVEGEGGLDTDEFVEEGPILDEFLRSAAAKLGIKLRK